MSQNGYLKDDELSYVQGENRLANAAANSFRKAVADASTQGVTLRIFHAHNNAGAYRPRWVSLDMLQNPQDYSITPGVTPALLGKHGEGNAVDIDSGLNWFIVNGKRYGWRRPLPTKDRNHFEYDGFTFADFESEPIIIEPKEKDKEMKFIRHPNGQIAFVGENRFIQLSTYTYDTLSPVWGEYIDVSEDAWTFQQAVSTGQVPNG